MLSFDFNNEVLKATPIAGTVVGDTASKLIGGFSINEWFYIAAIAYTVAQIVAKIVDTIINWKTQQSKLGAESKSKHQHYYDEDDYIDEYEETGGKNNGRRNDESLFD